MWSKFVEPLAHEKCGIYNSDCFIKIWPSSKAQLIQVVNKIIIYPTQEEIKVYLQ